jgi:integrase
MASTLTLKLTKRTVDQLPFAVRGQILYRDAEQPGFGLLIGRTTKTYIAEKRVRGRTVRTTLSRVGVLTAEQARQRAVLMLGRMTEGIDVNAERRGRVTAAITLQAVYDDYLASRSLRANTLRDYQQALENHFAAWRSKPIARLTRDMVERRFDELSANSAAVANRSFRALRAWCNFAMEKYEDAAGNPVVPFNPCARLKALKKWHRIPRRKRHIEPSQLAGFWRTVAHDDSDPAHLRSVKDLCALLLLTGLREQEGASLRWENIDLGTRQFTVPHTKTHRVHTLPTGEWLTEMLARRRVEVGMSAFVFPASNRDGHLKHHRKCVLAICQISQVEFRLHDLRRTFASIVDHHLARHLSAYTIKRLLNHSTDDVTAGYVQHTIDDLREAMQLVESFVLKCAGVTPVTRSSRPRTRVRGHTRSRAHASRPAPVSPAP